MDNIGSSTITSNLDFANIDKAKTLNINTFLVKSYRNESLQRLKKIDDGFFSRFHKKTNYVFCFNYQACLKKIAVLNNAVLNNKNPRLDVSKDNYKVAKNYYSKLDNNDGTMATILARHQSAKYLKNSSKPSLAYETFASTIRIACDYAQRCTQNGNKEEAKNAIYLAINIWNNEIIKTNKENIDEALFPQKDLKQRIERIIGLMKPAPIIELSNLKSKDSDVKQKSITPMEVDSSTKDVNDTADQILANIDELI